MKKNNIKGTNWVRKNKKIIIIPLIFLFGGILLYSGMLFFMGIHNVDLSFNVLKLSYDTGMNFWGNRVDLNLDGTPRSYSTIYINGWKVIINSYIIGVVSSFVLGVLLLEELIE